MFRNLYFTQFNCCHPPKHTRKRPRTLSIPGKKTLLSFHFVCSGHHNCYDENEWYWPIQIVFSCWYQMFWPPIWIRSCASIKPHIHTYVWLMIVCMFCIVSVWPVGQCAESVKLRTKENQFLETNFQDNAQHGIEWLCSIKMKETSKRRENSKTLKHATKTQ